MRKILLVLGVLIAVMPTSFIGIPRSIKDIFFILAGLFLFIVAFGYRSRRSEHEAVKKEEENTFVENFPASAVDASPLKPEREEQMQGSYEEKSPDQ